MSTGSAVTLQAETTRKGGAGNEGNVGVGAGGEWDEGRHLPLREAFFRPDKIFKDPVWAASSSSSLSTDLALQAQAAAAGGGEGGGLQQVSYATADAASSVVDATLQGMVR